MINAQLGAAAARGECKLVIDLAGRTVTLGAAGSVGSVEAGFAYTNTPGTWKVSVNGALLAGAGFSIRIDYD